jgi:hypothetical protein
MNAYESAMTNFRLAQEQAREQRSRLYAAEAAERKAFEELDKAEATHPLDYADWLERNRPEPIMSVDFALSMRDQDKRRIRLVGRPAVRCLGISKLVEWGDRTPHDARFRIAILDRDDGGRLKWLDFGDQLYQKFTEWHQCYAEQPGGAKGPDWVVKCERSRGSPDYKYLNATNVDRVPFTDFEIMTIKKANLREALLAWTGEDYPTMPTHDVEDK